jgi:UDP-N-acetylglucosamine transferase subunit ALG13
VIFATVGSQAPFDRLVRALDEWASLRGRSDVYAQIAAGEYRPQKIQFTNFMNAAEFECRMRDAQIVVAHAGMGSIITALELGKPIVVMPRRAHLRETRNEHQVATATRFAAQGRVIVAQDEQELGARLDYAVTLGESARVNAQASPRLIATIRAFLEGRPYQLDTSDQADSSEVKMTDGCNANRINQPETTRSPGLNTSRYEVHVIDRHEFKLSS